MSIKKKTGLLLIVLLALTACSELQQYKSNWPASVINGEQGADYWLAELHATRGMTADQQKQILKSREQEFHDNPTPGNRLRVALTGLTMSEHFRDEGRDVLLFIDNIYRYTLAGTEVSATCTADVPVTG